MPSRSRSLLLSLLCALTVAGCFDAGGETLSAADDGTAAGDASGGDGQGRGTTPTEGDDPRDGDAPADEPGRAPSPAPEARPRSARDDGRPPAGGVSGGRDSVRETLVVTETLQRGPIRDEIVVSARVESRTTVQVFPKLGGLPVTAVHVDEGDAVESGELLLELYDDELQLTEQERQAALDQATKEIDRAQLQLEEEEARIQRAERQAQKTQADLVRLEGLREEELVNQQEVDDARLAAELALDDLAVTRKARDRAQVALELARIAERQAELAWQRAEEDLSHTRVRAPLGGVVAERNVEIGELASQSEPAFVLVDVDEPVLNLRVPQDSLARLAAGQLVEAHAVTLPDTVFRGRVRMVSPVLDATTGSVHVIVDLEPRADLLPGLFCQAHIVTAARDDALLVDKRAVLHTDGLPHIFVLDESGERVRKLSFRPGTSTALFTEVLADAEGEPVPSDLRVVVVGQENLKDGGRVRLREEPY